MCVHGLYDSEFCEGLELRIFYFILIYIYSFYFIYSNLLFQQVRGRQGRPRQRHFTKGESCFFLRYRIEQEFHQLALFCAAS